MTRSARFVATTLAVGAATVGLTGAAHASEDGDVRIEVSDDANPGVLTGVGNLVHGVLNTDLVGNAVDGVF